MEVSQQPSEFAVSNSVVTTSYWANTMQPIHSMTHLMVTSLVLGTVTLATVVGNVFVIAAICLERHLRANVANYLIASLAVADLLVAVLVMPLAAVNDVTANWFLGPEVCDAWISFDVLCCTASILHLVAISIDRYWAVTRVDYIHNRSAKRMLVMISVSWSISAVISMIPQLFGLKHSVELQPPPEWLLSQTQSDWSASPPINTTNATSSTNYDSPPFSNVWSAQQQDFSVSYFRTNILFENPLVDDSRGFSSYGRDSNSSRRFGRSKFAEDESDSYSELVGLFNDVNNTTDPVVGSIYECVISQDLTYTVFSTVGAFYIPLAFITAVYLNVYRVARSRIHRKQFNPRHGGRQNNIRRGLQGFIPIGIAGAGTSAIDDDHSTSADPGGRDISSAIEPEKESNFLRVFGGLRSRLSAASIGSVPNPNPSFPMSPAPSRRTASFNNGATQSSAGADRCWNSSRSAAVSGAGGGHQAQLTVNQQLQPMPNSSRQFLSVNVSPRLSESSSPPSSTPSSRGGSWIYLTREYFLDVLSRRPPTAGPVTDASELQRYRERRARGRRERKAARTLAVITGTFVVCWLPFFTMATVRPFCGARCRRAIPRYAVSFIAWLGYVNSLVNPLIYTVFNPDFRRAFRRLLRLDRRLESSASGTAAGGGPATSRQGDAGRSTGIGVLRPRNDLAPDGITRLDVRSSAITV